MKKAIIIVLAVLTLIATLGMFASCGTTEGNDEGADTTAACSHDYESTVTPPTYTEKGFTTHKCKLCGDTFVDTYVDVVPSITLSYDDYVKSIGGILSTSETVKFEGDDCIEIKEYKDEKYFRAKGVGTVMVTDGNETQRVVVGKAKLHFVVVMGQSNAGNHFENSTSDITCDIGTAYFCSSLRATPKLYTLPSMGFHVPLIAELYAQSVAAGDPVKPVLIWNEGITSKNGESITAWASSASNSSGTDAAATMIKNATEYFTERADLYEIVDRGVYWIQGEADPNMDPVQYTQLFKCMWNKLKSAGMEYVAFFRVRRGVGSQGANLDHNDIEYHCALSAQLAMVNSNDDMYMASTITENWVGVENTKHSVDVSKYIAIMKEYGELTRFNDSYGNQATFDNGVITTTMKTLFGSNNKCHYGKFGAAIIGCDAAYNMYRALNGEKFAIVQADTSGVAATQVTSNPGETKTIDISKLDADLAFRPSCDSVAGKLSVKVSADGKDITSEARNSTGSFYRSISTAVLKKYQNVTITVTYTPVEGEAGSGVYTITK